MTLVTALDDLGPLLTASLDERVIHLHTAAVGQWKGGATASPSVIGTHSGTQVAGVCECFSRFVLQLLLHWERFFVPACTATPIRDAHRPMRHMLKYTDATDDGLQCILIYMRAARQLT